MRQKVHEAYKAYRERQDSDNFRRLYDVLAEEREQNRRCVVRNRQADEHGAIQVFDETVWKLSSRNDIDDFLHTLRASLKNARLNYLRGSRRRTNRFMLDDGSPKPEIASSYSLEIDVMERMEKKKRADIIDSILRPARTIDSVTTDIVTNLLDDTFDGNITALAKALCIDRKTVYRKLQSLRRHYDANRFGDIREYLAV